VECEAVLQVVLAGRPAHEDEWDRIASLPPRYREAALSTLERAYGLISDRGKCYHQPSYAVRD
jgi:hypothetical protein